MLVPPWNRIEPALIGELPRLGFTALSAFGRAPAAAPIPVVNTHVDLIDSRAGHRCREPGVLIGRLVEELARARSGGGHRWASSAITWRATGRPLPFSKNLFRLTAGHPACRWQGPADLVAG